MPHPTQTVHRHIRSLDGLRGLAFLMVFTFHYAISTHAANFLERTGLTLAAGGWIGVDLFFVLSGFLITGILIDTREGPHYYRNFYVRRALRIFPLFYGVLLLFLLLTPVLHLHWLPGHIWVFLYMGNFSGEFNPALNEIQPAIHLTHFWSLAVEEQFYFLWPLLVYRVRSRRNLVRLCLGLMAASFLLRALLVHRFSTPAFEWSYGLLPTHADGLLCGAICAILFRKYDIRTLLRWSQPVLGASLAILAFLFWHAGALNYHNSLFAIFGFPALAACSACSLLRFAQPRHIFARFGTLPFMRFFGKYSYGMYVYHQVFVPLTTPFLRFLQQRTASLFLGGILYFVLMLAATSLLSVLSFELYERHWLRLKSRFEYTQPRGSTHASSASQSAASAPALSR